MKYASLALGCALFFASPVAAETLTNTTVIALVRAGLGDEAVIAKIKASEGKYDLSTNDLIALKSARCLRVTSLPRCWMLRRSQNGPRCHVGDRHQPGNSRIRPAGILIDVPANRLDRMDPNHVVPARRRPAASSATP